MKKPTPHLRVRIDPRLLAKVKKAAKRNGNTLTGEIVFRLHKSFHADETAEKFWDRLWGRLSDRIKNEHCRTDEPSIVAPSKLLSEIR